MEWSGDTAPGSHGYANDKISDWELELNQASTAGENLFGPFPLDMNMISSAKPLPFIVDLLMYTVSGKKRPP